MFDDLFDSLFNIDFFPRDRRLARLVRKGTKETARIDGIHIGGNDDDERHYYRLMLADGTVFGSRQMLTPQNELARLGGDVVVRHRKGRGVIDWPSTLQRAGVRSHSDTVLGSPKRRPCEPGVRDYRVNRRRIERGRRAEAELVEFRNQSGTLNWDLLVQVGDERELLKRVVVPSYALYLLKPGATLPVAVDKRKVLVDWETAAQRDYAPRA